MKRANLMLLGLALVAVAGVAVAALHRPAVMTTTYTVTALLADLTHQPGTWIGRTVLVRGTAIGLFGPNCVPGAWCSYGLIDPGVALDNGTVLPLTSQSPAPWVILLRRTPWLGRLAPATQRLHWGRQAVYNVYIQGQATGACTFPSCIHAVLLDAPPAGPHGVMVTPIPIMFGPQTSHAAVGPG